MNFVVRGAKGANEEKSGLFAQVAAPAGSPRTVAAARAALGTEGKIGVRQILPFLGPAFVASVAYIDPGNFATNIQAGSQYGYLLLWVILASNLMAVLLQTLSAKLGIATGHNLPELARKHLP